MLSNLQLRHTAYLDVAIAVCEEGSFEGHAAFAHQMTSGIADKERHLWRVEMCIEIRSNSKKPFAYKGHVRVAGLIEAHPEFPPDKVADAVQFNGAALLYGVIRELVASITSRSAKGLLMLPSMNLKALLAQKKAPRKLRTKTAAAAKS